MKAAKASMCPRCRRPIGEGQLAFPLFVPGREDSVTHMICPRADIEASINGLENSLASQLPEHNRTSRAEARRRRAEQIRRELGA